MGSKPPGARRAARVRALAVAMLAVATLAHAAPRLGDNLPPGTPSRATLDGWERVNGEAATARADVVYEFYVEPSRAGLYTVTRYRLALREADAGTRLVSEKYIWNVGRGQPLRCFELLQSGAWRALAHGSEEYRAEMMTAMSVYALHRRASRERHERENGLR